MKVFFSILAFYMMAVFVMPCTDVQQKEHVHDFAHSQPLSEGEHQDHDHNEEKDFCSPFCLCSCCGAVSGITLQGNLEGAIRIESIDLPKPKLVYKPIFFLITLEKYGNRQKYVHNF